MSNGFIGHIAVLSRPNAEAIMFSGGVMRMNGLEFHVLGAFQVVKDGGLVALGGPQPRKVLALMLFHRDRVVSVEALVDALWAESPPETAVKTIHKYVSGLRKVLGEDNPIETRSGGYVVSIDPQTLDVERFERTIACARAASDPELACQLLESALELWRGAPWGDLDDDQAASAERARMEELRIGVLDELIDHELELGRHALLLPRLEEMVVVYPLRERAWARLMLALYRSGRQGEALDAYRRLRSALVDQLGIEPSEEVRELERRILEHDPDLQVPSSTMVRRARRGAELPAQLTRFVGRRHELGRVVELLQTTRLLTLTGVGGSGKTRLALEVAERSRALYPDGVWFVALDVLQDAELVPQAIAGALGAIEQQGVSLTDTAADILGDAGALLILDNCEHLLEPCVRVATALLGRCPELQILATSRERLGVRGETIFQVPPMPVPQTVGLPIESLLQHDSIELFVDRASAALVDFALTDDNKEQVARLCSALDGIPLALELAATRVAVMDPDEIARRIDDCLDLLANVGGVAPRQQTLRAAIDWSHELLAPDERELFVRLTVFAGGFDVAALEAVCSGEGLAAGDALNLLLELVDKSLVVRPDPDRNPGRYRVLEPLRSYGREKLRARGDVEVWRERHAGYYMDLAASAGRELRGPRQGYWYGRIQTEIDNIRATLEWARSKPAVLLTMMRDIAGYWEARGHPSEALQWLEPAIDDPSGVEPALLGHSCVAAAWHAVALGNVDRAEDRVASAFEVFRSIGDVLGEAGALHAAGWLAQHRGDYKTAERSMSESVALFRRHGDDWGTAWALHHMAMMLRLRGEYDWSQVLDQESFDLLEASGDGMRASYTLWSLGTVARYKADYGNARERCSAALQRFENLGDVSGAAHVRYTLGDIARLTGDHGLASELYTQSVAGLREMGDKRCVASTLCNLGANEWARSDGDGALSFHLEGLKLRCEVGDDAGIAECLELIAEVYGGTDRPSDAVRFLGAASELRAATGAVRVGTQESDYADMVAALRAAMSPSEYAAAWEAGAADSKRVAREPARYSIEI